MWWKNTQMKLNALWLDRGYFVSSLNWVVEQLVGEDADWIGFRFPCKKCMKWFFNHISIRPVTECREIETRKLYTFPLCKLRCKAKLLKYRKSFTSQIKSTKRENIQVHTSYNYFFADSFLTMAKTVLAARSRVLLWCNQALPFWKLNGRLDVDF